MRRRQRIGGAADDEGRLRTVGDQVRVGIAKPALDRVGIRQVERLRGGAGRAGLRGAAIAG